MGDFIPLFILVLALIAILLRADFVLTVIYLFIAVFFLGQWWSRRSVSGLSAQRVFTPRAFLNEKVPVSLQICNASLLPVAWLQVHESLPVGLAVDESLSQVISLGGKGQVQYDYVLEGRKRGYYPVGPLLMHSGDLFGLASEQEFVYPPDHLTVYPQIIPLKQVKLPSHSPLGTLRHNQPVYEDPSRVLGKRDYVAGDSLRRVDWKSTAATGRLQVKLFEPSIALETAIFLNLNAEEYDLKSRFDASELAIVVAASLANWIVGLRQSVGLATNGTDPLLGGATPGAPQAPHPIPPRRGRGHLMRILDILARIQLAATFPLGELIQRETVRLPWGTTLLVLSPHLDEALFDGLFQARRAGLSAVLIPCGPVANFEAARSRAEHFGFPLYQVLSERDLDLWRQ